MPRPGRRELRTLSASDAEVLFRSTSDDRLHALWALLVTTGLRIGEATGLIWEDIDLDAGRLTVRQALQRQRGAGLVFVEPKTASSRRTVHLPSPTKVVVAQHRHRQLQERMLLGPAWADLNLVFCHGAGQPLDPSFVSGQLHDALELAGLPRIRVHDLRHTAATLLLTQGVHPKVVQEMLGHSTITLTLDTYSHVTPAMHQEATRQIESIFAAI